MDFSESMKIVSSRIQEIEPEHACKIVGYLLLQECGDQDMIRLAFSPDNVIKSVTEKVKHILGLVYTTPICPQPNNPGPISDLPVPFNPYLAPSHSRACWNAQAYIEPVPQGYVLVDQFPHALNLDEHVGSSSSLDSGFYDNRYYPEPRLDRLGITRASRRSHCLSEFPPKVCHYFNRGFCKHGANCKYLHGNAMTLEGFSQLLGFGYNENRNGNGNGNGNDENMLSLWSLKNLEVEIIELLRSRKGNPISIASLPTLYGEKYGRILQAEGYLTESQRHGRAGFSLTKLLSRLNSICLIDRPHGQHSVILVEDAHKYLHYVSDQNELGGIVPGSRQVYLTFPADSTFTENDVSTHFNTYGPVQDVRIPCQQKRMFGFVTFVYQETAKKILSKGNPHFVCGSRVLVKPYREKSRLMDRRNAENLQQHSMHHNYQFDGEHDFHSLPRAYDDSRLMRQRFMEDRHLSARLHRFSNSMDELNLPEEFPTSEQFNSGSSNEEMLRDVTTSCSDQESNEGLINLPDNPFRDFNSYQHYPALAGASSSKAFG